MFNSHAYSQRYPNSSIGAIQERVGAEIPRPQIRNILAQMIKDGWVQPLGENRGRRYRLVG